MTTDDSTQIEDFLDMRREAIWVERSLHEIECLCDELVGRGYGSELMDKLTAIFKGAFK